MNEEVRGCIGGVVVCANLPIAILARSGSEV